MIYVTCKFNLNRQQPMEHVESVDQLFSLGPMNGNEQGTENNIFMVKKIA